MHDLRRQALQGSGKTVSRKARSRIASTGSSAVNSKSNSAANSRAASRTRSRQASDDEDYLSDGTAMSTNSIDDILNSEDVDAPPEVWHADLEERMEQLIDRKRSSVQGREESLATYNYLLMAHFAKEQVEAKFKDVTSAIVKSIKSESSEKETVLALKALTTTLVTNPVDESYGSLHSILKVTVSDSESIPTKTAAIHTLGALAFFCNSSVEDTREIMDFFLEIIESDGTSISADDSGDVVTAALEEWGFLATQIDDYDDLEQLAEPAMEAFVEQLASTDVIVQIAAGENVALLYEKSYTPPSDDSSEDDDDGAHTDVSEDVTASGDPVSRFTVYRQRHALLRQLEELASISGRGISKRDKKSLHTNFSDILQSVEYPGRGPRYSTATGFKPERRGGGRDRKGGGMADEPAHVGSRFTVRIGGQDGGARLTIDRWWKMARFKALKRALQAGFVTHWQQNEVVFDTLPVLMAPE